MTGQWIPRPGEVVTIECHPQDRGTVCRAAGGMLPHTSTVSTVIDSRKVFVEGVPRPFTLRYTGEFIMQRCGPKGPRLVRHRC